MYITIYTVLISVVIFVENSTIESNKTTTPQLENQDVGTAALKVLSRRKRFLIFPDGSSFQIVFCTQNHGYLQLGNIVWFGSTAALAWELPTDPGAFDMFRDRYKVYEGKRRSDVLYYVDEDGKVVDRIEFRRKIIINPAFAKRSVDAAERNKNITKLNKKEMHNVQKNKMVLKDLDTKRLEFHRKERQKLYVKLEKFLQALGWNGKECILKRLCETGKGKTEQESFVGEIVRAMFTLPKVPNSVSEVQEYDDAHGANGNCAELYPNCGDISIV